MSNTTKHRLTEQTMLRVRACAILFLDSSRKDRIARIADQRGIGMEDAAIMYTLGALKRAKIAGKAVNYRHALEMLEDEQVGWRGDVITRSESADRTAGTVRRINRANAGNRYDPAYISGRAAFTMPTDGRTVYGPMVAPRPRYPEADGRPEYARKKLGKVLGTLYAEWEARGAESDLADALDRRERAERTAELAQVRRNLEVFFADYESRLSKTYQARLRELARSGIPAAYLMGKGLDDPETKRLAWAAYRLYGSFPHKDSLTGAEYIRLVRDYVHA